MGDEDLEQEMFDAVAASSQPLPFGVIEAAESRSVQVLLDEIAAASEPLPATIAIAENALHR